MNEKEHEPISPVLSRAGAKVVNAVRMMDYPDDRSLHDAIMDEGERLIKVIQDARDNETMLLAIEAADKFAKGGWREIVN